jgi:hypothetical protein
MDLNDDSRPEGAEDVVDIPIYGSNAAGYPDGVELRGRSAACRST